jgi:protein tyrosine phosphatase (PTP) superfamily phosphohydrolase (DUF442 family)
VIAKKTVLEQLFVACFILSVPALLFSLIAEINALEPQDTERSRSAEKLPDFIQRLGNPKGLENLLRVGERIYSGGEPNTEGLLKLKELGITTIVSVDGLPPDLDSAEKLGLKYFHIPLGYDGIGEKERRQFATLMKHIKGKIYVHCHHGKHRGPAAVATCMIISGDLDQDQAMAYMAVAGTSRDYKGLWDSVASIRQGEVEVGSVSDLLNRVESDDIAQYMAKLDRRWEEIQEQKKQSIDLNFGDPNKLHQEVIAMMECLRESARSVQRDREGKWGDTKSLQVLVDHLLNSSATAEEFANAIKSGDKKKASERFTSLAKQCKSCHEKYRDHR